LFSGFELGSRSNPTDAYGLDAPRLMHDHRSLFPPIAEIWKPLMFIASHCRCHPCPTELTLNTHDLKCCPSYLPMTKSNWYTD
jgi:hypothetical protein